MDIGQFKLGVEFSLFFVYLGAFICESVNASFVIFRTCVVILGYNASDCAKLGSDVKDNFTNELETLTQPTANLITTIVSLFSQIVPAFCCLFIGPWSDKNGRKRILLITTLGLFLLYSIKFGISSIPGASPWFLMLECISAAFTGGLPTFLMISLCYVTDESTEENRGIRMAIFESVMASGLLIGNLSSSFLLQALGYEGVFLISAVCHFVAFILIACIKESIAFLEKTKSQGDTSLFSTKHVKEMIATTVKKRRNYGRPILFMLIFIMMLFIFSLTTGNCSFLYARAKFHWTLQDYTIYTSLGSVVWIFATFVGVYVMQKLLHIPEIILLLMGILSLLCSSVLQAFAITDWQVYAASGIGSLGGVVIPMTRSLISKEVPAQEIGKIFSLSVALDSFAVLSAGPIFTAVYNSTLETFPGMFNLVKSIAYITQTIIVLIIMSLRRFKLNATLKPHESSSSKA